MLTKVAYARNIRPTSMVTEYHAVQNYILIYSLGQS